MGCIEKVSEMMGANTWIVEKPQLIEIIKIHCFVDELGQECITILKKEKNMWREMGSEEQTELAIKAGFGGLWDWFYRLGKKYGDLCGKEFMILRCKEADEE